MASSSSSGGVGFFGLLLLLFVGLKLTGFIGWSWWWVLCPFWAPLAFAALCLTLWFVLVVVTGRK